MRWDEKVSISYRYVNFFPPLIFSSESWSKDKYLFLRKVFRLLRVALHLLQKIVYLIFLLWIMWACTLFAHRKGSSIYLLRAGVWILISSSRFYIVIRPKKRRWKRTRTKIQIHLVRNYWCGPFRWLQLQVSFVKGGHEARIITNWIIP